MQVRERGHLHRGGLAEGEKSRRLHLQTQLLLRLGSSHLSSSQSCPPQTLAPGFPLPVLTSPLFPPLSVCPLHPIVIRLAIPALLLQLGQQREGKGSHFVFFSFPTSSRPFS